MSLRAAPRVLSIAPGVPFLPALARALLDGELVPGFRHDGDPLALADVTIYVPTRRAARELRSIFVDVSGARSAILPVIRPLGEFDEDMAAFDAESAALDLAPPIAALDRLLLLAPLVQAWKRRLPAHIAARYGEDVTIPASAADAIWLARDLAALIDEVETEGADWSRLGTLVPEELAGWWQVTLEFLSIVTEHFPAALAERSRSSPGAHRAAMIDAETARLLRNPPAGPVIAAGSTGSIPATARLLSAIARLPLGAVVLPGLDRGLDAGSWNALGAADAPPSVCGHPQFGLGRLLAKLGIGREDVIEIGAPSVALAARARLVSEALRPAETTDAWAQGRGEAGRMVLAGALDAVSLVEAANERDEALAIAVALRRAVAEPERTAALVTGDRALARRVAVELRRFGIVADDSGGTPLPNTPPAALLRLAVEVAFRPGDPVAILSLLKHPLLRCGLPRPLVRRAAETIDLIALRGGAGRPDAATLGADFERRFGLLRDGQGFAPFWLKRLAPADIEEARKLAASLEGALAPLLSLRGGASASLARMAEASVMALENLGRDEEGSLAELYRGEAGEALAAFLRNVCAVETSLGFEPPEWPDILAALIAPEVVKPRQGADNRVLIWGALEARLQSVDMLVLGGLNEGSWPRRADADRFMSRVMKGGLELDPPERRIGLAAHDFMMAMGAPEVVLTRAQRAGDAPAVASRWLQRLTTYMGDEAASVLRARGARLLGWARQLDAASRIPPAERPRPTPPLDARPRSFSVTEIETLRRDPYAIYAKRVLKLRPLDPLIRDPGALERGNLFHDILHAFIASGADPRAADAEARLTELARRLFDEAALPADVDAVWWPRFVRMVPELLDWERNIRPPGIAARLTEVDAARTAIGATGATLHGRADRIDLHRAGMADLLDYKTGSSPSKAQAHTLLSPQLALEGALLMRGAFARAGKRVPSELAYVRLKPNGQVFEESVLDYRNQPRSAESLSEEAWQRLERLVAHYLDARTGYLSRALPFRESDTDGDYDHLARVLEWSAGVGEAEGGE